MDSPTFESILTPAGVAVASAMVLAFVSILKTIPLIDRNLSGALLAVLVSLFLYLAAAAVVDGGPNAYLNAAWCWILCASSAIGLNATGAHLGAVRQGVAGISPEITPISHSDVDESDAVEAASLPADRPGGANDAPAEPLPLEDPA